MTDDTPRAVLFVAFPKEAVDTIPCPKTGEPMPAQVVAQWGATVFIPCPHCPWEGGTMQWHRFELEAAS